MMLGIDVGGANTKAATSDGSFVRLIYAPLYRNKAMLHGVLADVKRGLEAEGNEIKVVGAVMTGELCGCFNTKRAGVLYIAKAVSDIFKKTLFFNTDCAFKNGSSVAKGPLSFAATNWLASAQFLSEEYKDVIFVDIGSTTTDVIPIVGGEIKAKKTDFERLQSGELIYSGELIDSLKRIIELYKLETVVSAGIGDFIVKKAADSINTSFISLSSIYGVDLSAVFPAYAVAKLLEASSSL